MSKDRVSNDEHIIVCSECGRDLIVRDTVNNGVAFLSHLKIDHGITFSHQPKYTKQTINITKYKNILPVNDPIRLRDIISSISKNADHCASRRKIFFKYSKLP